LPGPAGLRLLPRPGHHRGGAGGARHPRLRRHLPAGRHCRAGALRRPEGYGAHRVDRLPHGELHPDHARRPGLSGRAEPLAGGSPHGWAARLMTADGLSVVIPVFNEEESIPPLLESLHLALESLGRPYELIFVDDGSTDGTPVRLREAAARLPALRVI